MALLGKRRPSSQLDAARCIAGRPTPSAQRHEACRSFQLGLSMPRRHRGAWPTVSAVTTGQARGSEAPGQDGSGTWEEGSDRKDGLAGTGECGRGICDPRSWTGLDPPEVVRSPVEMVQPPDRGLRDAPVAGRRGRVVASAALARVVLLVEHCYGHYRIREGGHSSMLPDSPVYGTRIDF